MPYTVVEKVWIYTVLHTTVLCCIWGIIPRYGHIERHTAIYVTETGYMQACVIRLPRGSGWCVQYVQYVHQHDRSPPAFLERNYYNTRDHMSHGNGTIVIFSRLWIFYFGILSVSAYRANGNCRDITNARREIFHSKKKSKKKIKKKKNSLATHRLQGKLFY